MKRKNLQQLSDYLAASGRWCSAQELADYLHTTTRTVRNYVRDINCNAPDAAPILTSKRGYRWDVPDGTMQPFYDHNHPIPETSEERCDYILRQLLNGRDVEVEPLLRQLAISDRTLDADVQVIKGWLRAYDLRLQRRRDVLYLQGPQTEKRRLSVKVILRTTKAEFLSLDFVAGAFPGFDVYTIHGLLQTVLRQHGLESDGYAEYDLLLRVMIQLLQISIQSCMDGPEVNIEPFAGSPDNAAAQELAEMLAPLAPAAGAAYNAWETQYLAALLICKTTPAHFQGLSVSAPLQNYVLRVLGIAGRHLDVDLFSDSFPLRAAVFFQRMLLRQQLKLSHPNPLYPRLRVVYPRLHEVCLWMLDDFARSFQIQPDLSEAGFWMMLMAQHIKNQMRFEGQVSYTLLCPGFQHMATDLAKDLSAHLGDTLVLRSVESSLDLERLDAPSEMIVSVVPLRNFPHVVVISPYPKADDYRLIWQEVRQIKQEFYARQLSVALKDYLDPQFFKTGAVLAPKEELLSAVCDAWQAAGVVTLEFKTHLLCREALDNTAYFNTMALPHYCGRYVKKSAIYVALSQEPVPWGPEKINILLIMAFRSEEMDTFWRLYDWLIKLCSEPGNTKMLLQATDCQSFLQTLGDLGQKQ